MNALVELCEVSKQYQRTVAGDALHAITVSVHAKELLLVLGPSGSGKTTLLQVMAGLLAPSTGDCRLFGQRIEALPDHERQQWRARRIGFVFQNFRLLGSLTAMENVMLAAEFAGLAAKDARRAALGALEVVGLRFAADRRPATLSHGEQQRVAVARAIVNQAPLLLADEPTASLEAFHGIAVIRFLRDRVHTDGTGVVIASHDTRLIEYADRVLHLRDGAVVAKSLCA